MVMEKEKYKEIPINKIKIIENHRIYFDRRKLNELKQSIKETTLQSPIKVANNGKGGYVLISGERRLKACKELRRKTIKALIQPTFDLKSLLIDNLAENMIRADPTIAEYGRLISKLEGMGMTLEEIAKRIGYPPVKIKQIVRVYNGLPEKWRKKVMFMEKGGGRKEREGCIPVQAALRIVKMKKDHGLKDKHVDQIFKVVSGEGMDKLDLDNVGALMGMGLSVEAAMKNIQAYGVYTIDAVVKHHDVYELMEKHGVLTRKNFFLRVIYGEIPPLKKPSFVSTGVSFKTQKSEEFDPKPFVKMRQFLAVEGKAGRLTEEQQAALKSTEVRWKGWNQIQCEQIESLYNEIKSRHNGKREKVSSIR